MPLARRSRLGVLRSDITDAEARLRKYTADYTLIMNNRLKPEGLPAYIQPPKNAVRWQPRADLTIPVVPAAADQAVLSERIPLGYDGTLIAITTVWNGTGFVEASGDITWRVKIDGRFVPFFEAITVSLGSLTVPFDVAGQGITLLSGQLVQIFANFLPGSEGRLNVGGKTICAASAYIWPRERPIGL